MECPTCFGLGCEHCDSGEVRIEGCPQNACRDMFDTIEIIDLFYKGLPPVVGGVLNQAAWFIDAAKRFSQEEIRVKNNG